MLLLPLHNLAATADAVMGIRRLCSTKDHSMAHLLLLFRKQRTRGGVEKSMRQGGQCTQTMNWFDQPCRQILSCTGPKQTRPQAGQLLCTTAAAFQQLACTCHIGGVCKGVHEASKGCCCRALGQQAEQLHVCVCALHVWLLGRRQLLACELSQVARFKSSCCKLESATQADLA